MKLEWCIYAKLVCSVKSCTLFSIYYQIYSLHLNIFFIIINTNCIFMYNYFVLRFFYTLEALTLKYMIQGWFDFVCLFVCSVFFSFIHSIFFCLHSLKNCQSKLLNIFKKKNRSLNFLINDKYSLQILVNVFSIVF